MIFIALIPFSQPFDLLVNKCYKGRVEEEAYKGQKFMEKHHPHF
jgi:hypothetical protein